jgi:hypothetical protein
MKVRKGGVYVYRAEAWDRFDARHDLQEGEHVRVVHPYGCPAPNVMDHAHVERLTGQFVGLVCTASLHRE